MLDVMLVLFLRIETTGSGAPPRGSDNDFFQEQLYLYAAVVKTLRNDMNFSLLICLSCIYDEILLVYLPELPFRASNNAFLLLYLEHRYALVMESPSLSESATKILLEKRKISV